MQLVTKLSCHWNGKNRLLYTKSFTRVQMLQVSYIKYIKGFIMSFLTGWISVYGGKIWFSESLFMKTFFAFFLQTNFLTENNW